MIFFSDNVETRVIMASSVPTVAQINVDRITQVTDQLMFIFLTLEVNSK